MLWIEPDSPGFVFSRPWEEIPGLLMKSHSAQPVSVSLITFSWLIHRGCPMRVEAWLGLPRPVLPSLDLEPPDTWAENLTGGQEGAQGRLVPDVTPVQVTCPCCASVPQHCFPLSIPWSEWEAIRWTQCAPGLKRKKRRGCVWYCSNPWLLWERKAGVTHKGVFRVEICLVEVLAGKYPWIQKLSH